MHFDFVLPVFTDGLGQVFYSDAKKGAGTGAWFAQRTVSELDFFIAFGEALERQGKTVAFLVTTTRILERLRTRFAHVFYMYEGLERRRRLSDQEIWDIERKYRLTSLRSFVYAEREYDWALDYDDLLPRAAHVLRYVERFVTEHSIGAFIGSLGGEVPRRATFTVGGAHGIPSEIFDFAAIPGRFLISDRELGVLIPPIPDESAPAEDLAWAREYVDAMLSARKPWAAASPLGFSRANFRGALTAIAATRYQKDVSIKRLVSERFRRVGRRAIGTVLWQEVDFSELFLFFPVHQTNDTVVTLRAPQYQRQDELIQFIAERALPAGVKLYVKPHIAARDLYKLDFLAKVRRLPNVKLVAPATNPHDLIEKALATIVINSTTGFESIIHGKPAIVVGTPWYARQGLTVDVDQLNDLPAAVERALTFKPSEERLLQFLAHYRAMTHEGVFGLADQENVERLARVLVARAAKRESARITA